MTRVPVRLTAFAALAGALAGLTCAFPTDKSDEITVVIQAPRVVVIRGEQLRLSARAFRASGTDTVKNVVFRWTSSNTTLATVQDDGAGYAQVTGVKSGTVEITAQAVAFEAADVGSLQVRVSEPLEVDSVRPSIVRFGDTVTVFGVGVDSIFLAFLDDATLFDYPIPLFAPTRSRDSLGFARATFWIPPPARSSQLTYIGPGVFGEAPDSTKVLPFDVLEPNETAPRLIDLDAPPRFPAPALSFIKFFNPALAFEIPRRDENGIEWYRFSRVTPGLRDLTIILAGPDVRGTFTTFVTDSLEYDPTGPSYPIGLTSWTIGPGDHACGGVDWFPAELPPESTIVALRAMPAGVLHVLAEYTQPGRYGLTAYEGYATSVAGITADDHEEDDFCNAADARGLFVTLPGERHDTLTIDNAHDVDWIRFAVGGVSQTVRFRVASLVPNDTLSDVDLYILSLPGAGLLELGSGIRTGSSEDFTVTLSPGQYYAVAVDYAGAPVRYALCIGPASGCLLFPAATAVTAAPAPQPVLRASRSARPLRSSRGP